jgi:hypothetical protein
MPESELNDVERRLSGWWPASDGLDADAMLYAAGRASVTRSPLRFAWPAIAACLAIATSIVSARLVHERTQNQQLFARLWAIETTPRLDSGPLTLPETSLFAARRALDRDPDGWMAPAPSGDEPAISQPALHAGQRDFELDQ